MSPVLKRLVPVLLAALLFAPARAGDFGETPEAPETGSYEISAGSGIESGDIGGSSTSESGATAGAPEVSAPETSASSGETGGAPEVSTPETPTTGGDAGTSTGELDVPDPVSGATDSGGDGASTADHTDTGDNSASGPTAPGTSSSGGDDTAESGGTAAGGSATGGGATGSPTTGSVANGAVEPAVAVEHSADGSEIVPGAIVALVTPDDVARLRRFGVTILEEALSGLGDVLVTLTGAKGTTPGMLADLVHREAPSAIADFDHVFRLAGARSGHRTIRKSLTPLPARGAPVGMIDTAVDPNYPTLLQNIPDQRSFVSGRIADASHGTAIAEILASNGARVIAANVFTQDNQLRPAATTAAIVKALDWLVASGVTVINLSFTGAEDRLLTEAIRRAQARGCIIVAAAGNAGPAAPASFPASYPGVVAVTAVDRMQQVYRYANQGTYISFAALGVDIDTPQLPSGRHVESGTSFAAPVVAAGLAQAVSVRTPEASTTLLHGFETRARDLGSPGRDPVYGFGLFVAKPEKNK